MTNEWLMILSVLWSIGLFAAGGTDLNGKGHKWLRRFVLPAGLGALALLYAPWWACIGYTLTLCAFLHMGYGSKASWLYRAFIFTGYGASALWFGWSGWVVATPILCLLAFWLSNQKKSESMFAWKIVEMLFGFLIAVTYINSLQIK
jgi:heme/copper-type cytochrome/quinol oxidase subunit 4